MQCRTINSPKLLLKSTNICIFHIHFYSSLFFFSLNPYRHTHIHINYETTWVYICIYISTCSFFFQKLKRNLKIRCLWILKGILPRNKMFSYIIKVRLSNQGICVDIKITDYVQISPVVPLITFFRKKRSYFLRIQSRVTR